MATVDVERTDVKVTLVLNEAEAVRVAQLLGKGGYKPANGSRPFPNSMGIYDQLLTALKDQGVSVPVVY